MCPQKTVNLLREAYTFLRNLEHRLMYVEDAQTQALPKSDEARARIAIAMGFVDWPAFLAVLNVHRQIVQQHFDETFSDASEDKNTCWILKKPCGMVRLVKQKLRER